MKTIVLDLETYRTRDVEIVKQIELEARAKRPANNTAVALKQVWDTPMETDRRTREALDMTAVDVLIAEPLVVCLDIDGDELTFDLMLHPENETLLLVAELLTNASQQTLWVGHNVEFDLAILLNRWRKWRIPVPAWYPSYRRRWHGRIHDTMFATPCKSGLNYVSLETVCAAYGLPPAKSVEYAGAPMEGSRVGDVYRSGQYDLICEYCMADVRATKELYSVQTSGAIDKYADVVERLRTVDSDADMTDGARALTKLQILESCGFMPR